MRKIFAILSLIAVCFAANADFLQWQVGGISNCETMKIRRVSNAENDKFATASTNVVNAAYDVKDVLAKNAAVFYVEMMAYDSAKAARTKIESEKPKTYVEQIPKGYVSEHIPSIKPVGIWHGNTTLH